MENYINMLKEEFYNNVEFKNCINCRISIIKPKYSNLLFGYILGKNKQMIVLNLNTKQQNSY